MSERELLVDMVSRLLRDQCGPEVVAASEGTWAAGLWSTMEEVGLTRLSLPDESGGGHGSFEDLAVVLQLVGRNAAPVPLAETAMLAGWLLAKAGFPIPEGPLVAILPASDSELAFGTADDGFFIDGLVRNVPWARVARHLVVIDATAPCRLALVDRRTATVEEGSSLSGEPLDAVRFDSVRVAEADTRAISGATVEHLKLRGALSRCLMMTGAIEAVLELARQYGAERQQFGQPINRFQAVQHQLAELVEEAYAARSITQAAVQSLASDGGEPLLIAAAKIRVGEAAGRAASLAHQIHGAIGFTQEHQLHHFTRRLWTWREQYGTESEWARVLGGAAIGAEPVWELITSRL